MCETNLMTVPTLSGVFVPLLIRDADTAEALADTPSGTSPEEQAEIVSFLLQKAHNLA